MAHSKEFCHWTTNLCPLDKATNAFKPSIDPWVFRELGLASFGDARLTARALRLASDLAARPGLSLASLYEGGLAVLRSCEGQPNGSRPITPRRGSGVPPSLSSSLSKIRPRLISPVRRRPPAWARWGLAPSKASCFIVPWRSRQKGSRWVGLGRLRGHAIGGRLRPAALPFLWQVGMA